MKKALATMGFVATLATPAFVEADTIYIFPTIFV